MATPLLGLYAPADGSDTGAWGHNFVNGLSTTLDNVIGSFQAISVTGLSSSNDAGGHPVASLSLNAAQCGAQMLRITGNVTYTVNISSGGNLWNGIRCVENLATQTGGPFNMNLVQGGPSVTIAFNTRALVFLDAIGGPRIIAQINVNQIPDIPSGTVASFYQSSAPAGWTISSALNDYGLRVVSSSGGVTGTGQAYSVNFAQTSTAAYTLLTADFPSHNHTITGEWLGNANQGFTSGFFNPGNGGFTASTDLDIHEPPTGNTGGGGPHSHGLTMTVQTADFILATKN